jgi:hypothetical protein
MKLVYRYTLFPLIHLSNKNCPSCGKKLRGILRLEISQMLQELDEFLIFYKFNGRNNRLHRTASS